jgi:hypothetical protein
VTNRSTLSAISLAAAGRADCSRREREERLGETDDEHQV